MVGGSPAHEGRHEPTGERLWNEWWYFDFAAPDGSLGGFVRLGLYPSLGMAWYWAYLVRRREPLLVVRHHEAAVPRGRSLEVREEALWSALYCETPGEHWTIGLEAFAVALDDPMDAYRGERGDRVALGFDLEWEAEAPTSDYAGVTRYGQPCRVSGEILVDRQRLEFSGWGHREHGWGVWDWWRPGWIWAAGRLQDGTAFQASAPGVHAGDGLPGPAAMALEGIALTASPLMFAPLPLDAPNGSTSRLVRALSRFDAVDARWGFGWAEWCLGPPAIPGGRGRPPA